MASQPATFRQIDDEEEEEEEEEELRASGSGRRDVADMPGRTIRPTPHHHDPPCSRCSKAKRPCVMNQGGGSCVACKQLKYRCDYATKAKGTKRSRVSGEELESENDEVEVGEPPQTGKKHQSRVKAKPARSKAKPVKKARAPKTPRYVEMSGDDEEQAGELSPQSEVPEPKRKRARPRPSGKQGKTFSLPLLTMFSLYQHRSRYPPRGLGVPACQLNAGS